MVEFADADRESERLQRISGRDRGLVSRQMHDQAQANADAARKQLSDRTWRSAISTGRYCTPRSTGS